MKVAKSHGAFCFRELDANREPVASDFMVIEIGAGLYRNSWAYLPTPQLSSRFDSCATHARKLFPAEIASVPFGSVLARVFETQVFFYFKKNLCAMWNLRIMNSIH